MRDGVGANLVFAPTPSLPPPQWEEGRETTGTWGPGRTLLAALALDLLLGDPPNAMHPVAWIGRFLGLLRNRASVSNPKAELVYGAAMVAVIANVAIVPALSVRRWAERRHPVAGFLVEVMLLKSMFALKGLLDAGARVEDALRADDLTAARTAVGALVSRDVAELTAEQVAAAAVESLAENLTDSVIAPLLAYRIGGLPLAIAYRVVNTADAMVGYRGHYEYLGKIPARIDDVANFVPARLSALLIAAAAPLVSGSLVRALRMVWRDGGATASPNAGLTMAAAAGALDIQLEKPGQYRLGDAGAPVTADTIKRARRLVAGAAMIGVGLLVLSFGWRGGRQAVS